MPASSMIILSNLTGLDFLDNRFRDCVVQITICFFLITSSSLLNGMGRLLSAPGAYPLLTHINFEASCPSTILNSLENSLAAELVNATNSTRLAYPSETSLMACRAPNVVFPQPGGPITPAIPPELIRHLRILC